MARRSRARQVALQLLYEADRNPGTPEDRDRAFIDARLRGLALRQFATELISGVRSKRDELDQVIQQVAQNWTVNRMTPIDRSILRLATFEVLFRSDAPPKVVIDEAIELAKRFGTAESSRFVNGILDRIVTDHRRSTEASPSSEASDADLAHPIDSTNSIIA